MEFWCLKNIYLTSTHTLSEKIFLQCVASSVYWPAERGMTMYAEPDMPATRYDRKFSVIDN